MGFVVKSTTKCGLLDLLCPHACRGCGRLGEIVCGCCKNNLISAKLQVCPLCQQVIVKSEEDSVIWQNYKCRDCDLPLDALFVGGWRQGLLAKLVKDYKYQGVRAIGDVLTEVLVQAIPELPKNVVVIPLPTVGKHVRERGVDHTKCLAKRLARRRGWKCQQLLLRAADTVQVGTKMSERHEQAKRAYMTLSELDSETYYLLLDDVWTTGASMLAATEILHQAGAKHVLGVVVAAGKQKVN